MGKHRIWLVIIGLLIAGALWTTLRTENKWKEEPLAPSPCTLMEHKSTAEMKCFGCGGTICTTPSPMEWTIVEENSPKCTVTENGCELRQ